MPPDFASDIKRLTQQAIEAYGNRQHDAAIALYREVCALTPNFAGGFMNLGLALEDQGAIDDAEAAYRHADRLKPSAGVKLRLATMVHPIAPSADDIQRRRGEILAALEALAPHSLPIRDPYREFGQNNFYLAYQGLNDREIQTRIARYYLAYCPDLGWTAPHCEAPRARSSRPRLGVLSAFLHQHTVAHLMWGLIDQWKERFDVTVFTYDSCLPPPPLAGVRRCSLPDDWLAARRAVASQAMDVLFYPEIGMDTLTYFMAFSRLAPVQCVTWGHPETTGIPNVDYFISSTLIEPDGAAAHYSEQLAALPELPVYYARPALPEARADPAPLGVEEGSRLYLCPQSAFKLHPQFDRVLAAILEMDERAAILLMEPHCAQWKALLLTRLAQSAPHHLHRVKFLPSLPRERFLSWLLAADVVLDPPYFGGGNTTFEALALGAPIVTWPGPCMKGRVTAGCYKKMGMDALVVSSLDAYARRAVQVANDAPGKDALRNKILARAGVLFENAAAADAMAELFLTAHRRA